MAEITDTQNIELRPAGPEEKDAILKACRDTLEQHRAALPFAFHEDAFERFYAPYIASSLTVQAGRDETDDTTVQAAFVDGKFAGYAILAESRSTGGGLEIFDIHVFAPFRKKGVGQALLAWCKARAEAAGAHNLDATVWALGDGRAAFFEKSGFQPVNSVWRVGPHTPPPSENMPRESWVWRVLFSPVFLWLVIALLAFQIILLVMR